MQKNWIQILVIFPNRHTFWFLRLKSHLIYLLFMITLFIASLILWVSVQGCTQNVCSISIFPILFLVFLYISLLHTNVYLQASSTVSSNGGQVQWSMNQIFSGPFRLDNSIFKKKKKKKMNMFIFLMSSIYQRSCELLCNILSNSLFVQ